MSIKPNELRIGNWVQSPLGDFMKVEIIGHQDYTDYIFAKSENGFGQNTFEPIPITPEILLACGFQKRTWGKPDTWDKYGDSFAIGSADTNYVLHRSWEKEPDWCMCIEPTDALKNEDNYKSEHFCWEIKHLHQLQNLYWCLVGEELNINL